jgi:hypothetical protein
MESLSADLLKANKDNYLELDLNTIKRSSTAEILVSKRGM